MRSKEEITEMFCVLKEICQKYSISLENVDDVNMAVNMAGIMETLAWVLGIPTPVENLLTILKEGKENGWQDAPDDRNGTVH